MPLLHAFVCAIVRASVCCLGFRVQGRGPLVALPLVVIGVLCSPSSLYISGVLQTLLSGFFVTYMNKDYNFKSVQHIHS